MNSAPILGIGSPDWTPDGEEAGHGRQSHKTLRGGAVGALD